MGTFYEEADLSTFETRFCRLACFPRKLFGGCYACFGHDFRDEIYLIFKMHCILQDLL